MTVSRHISRLFLLLFTAICFQLPLARAAGSVPTVRTDKPDYPPGDTAEITGNGFLPGEQVECQVLRLDAPFDPSVAHLPWLVPVDASGNFQTTWFVTWDAAGATLELTAVGQTSSLVASVTFSDSANSCPPPPTGTPLTGTPAGGFAIDGDLQANANTGDWIPGSGSGGAVMNASGIPLNAATTFHLTDGFGAAENNFNGGLKVDNNPNVWTWIINPTPDKDDINNALIHISTASDGHRWLVVSADRANNNGDSYVDFEFLQSPLSITTNYDGISGGFSSAGPHGGRTTNDFLLTVSFTKGGTTPGVCLERWLASGTGYDYVDASLPPGFVFGAVNTSVIPVPYGAFGSATYAVNTFAEVAVDVTELMAEFDHCLSVGVRSIMVKTKTSQSPQATIVDFIAPLSIDLKLGPSADAGPDQAKCSEGASTTFTLDGKAYAGLDPIVSTNWTVVSGSATIDSPNSLTTSVQVSSASATLRLTLSSAVDGGCAKTDDVVLTVNQPPSCSITGATSVCPTSTSTYSGPVGMASYAWSISGSGTIVGSTSSQSISVTASGGCNQNFTLTLTVIDGIGCSSTCRKDCTVNDTVTPTITSAPTGGDLGCNPGMLPTDESMKALVTASDDCTATPAINVSHVDGGTACASTRAFTITATDACNNTSAPTTVIYTWKADVQAPKITGVPPGGDLGCNPTTLPTDATVKALATATDDCTGSPTINVSHVDGGTACAPTRTFMITATDGCNNTSGPSTVVYNWKSDMQAPTITGVPAGGDLGCTPETLPTDVSVKALVTATDDCTALPTINVSHVDGGTTCAPTRTFTITATDGCNNTSTPSTLVYSWKADIQPPTITSISAGGDLGCNPASLPTDASVKALVTATDDCTGLPTIIVSHVDGGTACAPTRTFTITATDGCNNTSSPSTLVYSWKVDIQPPTITGIPAGGDLGCHPATLPTDASVKALATATDDCTGSPIINVSHVDGGTACAPTRTFTITATDACNNTSGASTVVYSWQADIQAPTITSVPADGDLGCNPASLPTDASVKVLVTATDDCTGSPIINVSHLDGGTACAPTRTFTIRATDACNNTSAPTTVNYHWKTDTAKPVFNGLPALTAAYQCYGDVPAPHVVTANDSCDGQVTVNYTQTPANPAGSCNVTITRTWTAIDNCGNTASFTQTITLNDTLPPVVTCPSKTTVRLNSPTDPSVTGSATATDNCDPAPTITHSDSTAPGNCPNTTLITRTWTATDACGNQSSCVQSIVVGDTIAPSITCPPTATVECNTSTDPSVTGRATVTAGADPNPVVTHSDNESPGNCPNTKVITRTWTATDSCGNETTCVQTISVVDTIAPVFSRCPADMTVDCKVSTEPSTTGSPTATDNCDPNPTISYSDAVTGTCSKIITRTWTATDCAGHSSRCVQTITVSDATAPLIDCPPDTTVKEYTPIDPSVTGRATATDDCDPAPLITYTDATNGVSPVIITRTWTATDCAGNQSACNQTIRILDEPTSEGTLITDTMRCTLPNNQLRLIFTQDTQNMPCYKLTASNPGQFYYNVFYSAAPGSSVTFHVTLPYPWVTQGARPIEVYDGVTANTSGGQTCLVPGHKILAGSQQVTLSNYGSKPMMGVTTYTLNVTVTVPSTGFVFLAIHLDYGLKASSGYGQNGAGDATMCASTGTVLIPNNQSYTFSVTGAASGNASVSSYNAFKKNPGVGGLAQSQTTTFSVPGSTVKLKDAKAAVLASSVTDQDGWYVVNFKANGKAATYYVTLTPPAGYGTAQTKAISLKANGYVQVDFTTK